MTIEVELIREATATVEGRVSAAETIAKAMQKAEVGAGGLELVGPLRWAVDTDSDTFTAALDQVAPEWVADGELVVKAL